MWLVALKEMLDWLLEHFSFFNWKQLVLLERSE